MQTKARTRKSFAVALAAFAALALHTAHAADPAPTVKIIAPDPTALDGVSGGSFVVVRNTGDYSSSLRVYLTVGGTATNGWDYRYISNSVVIPAGYGAVDIPVVPIINSNHTGNGTVILSLSADPATNYVATVPTNATVTLVYDSYTQPEPTVTLTSPTNGVQYYVPANVLLQAAIQDQEGTVTNVSFYAETMTTAGTVGAISSGNITKPPYAWVFTNAQPGLYTLFAKAVDNVGQAFASRIVQISVTNPNPATITLSAPTNGTTVTTLENVALRGKVGNDPYHTVSTVTFSITQTSTGKGLTVKANTDSTGSASASVAAPDAGLYRVVAQIGGDNPLSTPIYSQPAQLTILPKIPVFNFTSPVPKSTFSMPAVVTIAGTVTDLGQALSRLEIIATRGDNPMPLFDTITTKGIFSTNWAVPGPGNYYLKALALDNNGRSNITTTYFAVTNSPAVSLSVLPAQNVYTQGATVTMTATVSDNYETNFAVSFFQNGKIIATLTAPPYTFVYSNIPCPVLNSTNPSPVALTAQAVAQPSGMSTTSPAITILVTPKPLRAVTFSPNGGIFDGSLNATVYCDGASGLVYRFADGPWKTNTSGSTILSLDAAATTNSGSITAFGIAYNGTLGPITTSSTFTWQAATPTVAPDYSHYTYCDIRIDSPVHYGYRHGYYYTTDGSEPTATATECLTPPTAAAPTTAYMQPPITQPCVLKVKNIYPGYLASPTVSVVITQTPPPTLSCNLTNVYIWGPTNLGTCVYYQINGAPWQNFQSTGKTPLAIRIPSGVITPINAYAVGAGLQSATIGASFSGSSVNPLLSLQVDPILSSYPQGTNVTLRAIMSNAPSANYSIRYFSNGALIGSATNSPYSFVYTNLPFTGQTNVTTSPLYLTAQTTLPGGATLSSSPITISVTKRQ